MNPWQMAQQLKHVLQAASWPSGSEGLLFSAAGGSVVVFTGAPTEEQIPPQFPWCLIEIGESESDDDHPDILTQTYRLIVAAEVAGDRMGEQAVIGGPATDLGRSAGRGVQELIGETRRAVQSLTGLDGAKVLVSATSSGPTTALGRGKHLAMAEVTLSAVCCAQPHYAAPQRIRYESGRWKWDGAHCEARFDFFQYRLLRKSGNDPSAHPQDGTSVYNGTTAEWTGQQISGSTTRRSVPL